MSSNSATTRNLRYAPICIFTYNRLEETQLTVEALRKNDLASESDLFIFCDGPKDETDHAKINGVLEFVRTIKGFKTTAIKESVVNMGLSKSIISGVTEIIAQYGKVIVLEDDLITSSNFLNYMNDALTFFEDKIKVFSISGYSMKLKLPEDYAYDYYFLLRASSWGQGTWRNRWEAIDWEISDYSEFVRSKEKRRSFNIGGSDLTPMLRNQMTGKINSWAIRWCYNQWKKGQLTVYPRISKVKNIGFRGSASNTKHRVREFETDIDNGLATDFSFSSEIILDEKIISLFRRKFSVAVRMKIKILKLFSFLNKT